MTRLSTFEERFEYLRLNGTVAEPTFGFDRYLNQRLYQSREWKRTRHGIILRDGGCDLGIPGLEIFSQLIIHHINPLTMEDLEYGTDCVFDPNNLITTRLDTHNTIHYGDKTLLVGLPTERSEGDTCLWSRR